MIILRGALMLSMVAGNMAAGGMRNEVTLQTYQQCARAYLQNTTPEVTGSKKAWLDRALELTDKKTTILEIGSGFGRDALYMQQQGYQVACTDAVPAFLDMLQEQGLRPYKLNALTDPFGGPFGMLYANFVFLHFTRAELKAVLSKAYKSLQSNGILAFSVKPGDGEGWEQEKLGGMRYFCYWRSDELKALLEQALFQVIWMEEVEFMSPRLNRAPVRSGCLQVIARKQDKKEAAVTKYVLIGGYASKAADGGKAACEEMVKGFQEPIKMLICLFARPAEGWASKFEEDKAFIAGHLPGRAIHFRMASVEDFAQEVAWADVIYLRGGDTPTLMTLLNKDRSWLQHLTGKTVVGTSAGACVVAAYDYDLDHHHFSKNLGLLPIKVIPHFRSDYGGPTTDWDGMYRDLAGYQDQSLEVVTLREGEFRVFERV